MPELPDLTVFAENLHRRISGKKISSIDDHGNTRLNVDAGVLRTAMSGQVVKSVTRSGKEILLTCSDNTRLLIHLMLAGRFVFTDKPERLSDKILTISFAAGPSLTVTDPKRLVKVQLNPADSRVPDALAVDAAYLRRKCSEKPRTLMKALLIDQTVLRGIGNAYADEILWLARISPKAATGRIPEALVEELALAIRKVLNEAIGKIRGINPEIIGGEIRDFLLIHNPHQTQSPTGRPILKEKIASKTTYFTDEQILY
jgi:formamidopyrimidine-DNA glycosylase